MALRLTLRQLRRGFPVISLRASALSTYSPLQASSTAQALVQISEDKHFHPTWLRQNCQCPTCFNHDTNQNNILPHHVKGVTAKEVSSSGDDVSVTWSDGHKSTYSATWLTQNSYPGQEDKTKKLFWNGDVLKSAVESGELPKINSNAFMKEEASLKELMSSLLKYGIGIVCDVPSSIQHTQECVERVSFIEETMFGRMWSFTSDLARQDTAYTSIEVGSHTDTTYLTIPAGIQVFHCLYHDGEGGETSLVDGFQAAETLRKTNPEAFDLLSKTRVNHHYLETGHHTVSLDSILKTHPVSGAMECIRYNHYDRAPITTIRQEELQSFYDALEALSHVIEDPSNQYWMKLKPGTVLFVENWRVLHGRASFTGSRRMCGCYLPRTSWQSLARILGTL